MTLKLPHNFECKLFSTTAIHKTKFARTDILHLTG